MAAAVVVVKEEKEEKGEQYDVTFVRPLSPPPNSKPLSVPLQMQKSTARLLQLSIIFIVKNHLFLQWH